ncbi:hypothetical protein [Stappia sp. P2PMeth1]|uniref:hypothetical protein n=1 Tax=Stappia sp. P2PMeth1 TaxID=2003586 RepID=UPI001647D872|nr:hypothetical protein [Stappia sp. P2PMeth1]
MKPLPKLLWPAGTLALAAAIVTWIAGGKTTDAGLHLSMASIQRVANEEIVPVSALLDSTATTHVCSIGPYFDEGFARNQLDQQLLSGLAIFPVPESDGLFVYVTTGDAAPVIDRLQLNSGQLRWRADKNDTRCLSIALAAFTIKKQSDHWAISLVEMK